MCLLVLPKVHSIARALQADQKADVADREVRRLPRLPEVN